MGNLFHINVNGTLEKDCTKTKKKKLIRLSTQLEMKIKGRHVSSASCH